MEGSNSHGLIHRKYQRRNDLRHPPRREGGSLNLSGHEVGR